MSKVRPKRDKAKREETVTLKVKFGLRRAPGSRSTKRDYLMEALLSDVDDQLDPIGLVEVDGAEYEVVTIDVKEAS